MTCIVGPCTCAELAAAPNWLDLVEEYVIEARIKGLPRADARLGNYATLEAAGMIHPFSATVHDQLVGFVVVLGVMIPHYSAVVACTESFFVSKPYRKTGAGLKLLRLAERKAHDLNSPGLLVSAPFESDLSHVLSGLKYAPASTVYFKAFQDG